MSPISIRAAPSPCTSRRRRRIISRHGSTISHPGSFPSTYETSEHRLYLDPLGAPARLEPGGSPSPPPPPLAPDDPRTGLNLAAPDLTDDFSVRFKWYEFSDATSASNLVEDGHLKAVDNLADSYIWWSTTDSQAEDVD